MGAGMLILMTPFESVDLCIISSSSSPKYSLWVEGWALFAHLLFGAGNNGCLWYKSPGTKTGTFIEKHVSKRERGLTQISRNFSWRILPEKCPWTEYFCRLKLFLRLTWKLIGILALPAYLKGLNKNEHATPYFCVLVFFPTTFFSRTKILSN